MALAGRRRLGLRPKLMIASVLLVAAPLVVVWSIGLVEDVLQAQIAFEIDRSAARLVEEARGRGLEAGALSEEDRGWLEGAAAEGHVMLRVLDGDGRERLSTSARDAERWIAIRAWWMGLDDFFFGPPGPPDLEAQETSLPPPRARPEVRAALGGRVASRWRYDEEARMMVYSVAAPLPGGGVLTLTRISRRVIRSLYGLRYQLLKLTLFMAALAALLALWVSGRVVSPLIRIQRRISTYLRDPGRGDALEGLSLERQDELGDLSRAFEELTSRLRRQAEEATSLAGDLAHDLKNPIATVTATAELLEGDAPSAERRQRIARALGEAAAHMNRSVDGLLRLARLEASLAEEERGVVDLARLASEVVEGARRGPRGEEIRLVLETRSGDAGGLAVLGVGAQLEQLLRNLIDNALVFAEAEIRLVLERRGPQIHLLVCDDGPGVSAGNRGKVFRRFFTVRPQESPGGSGLGLAMVAAVARAHGGEVTLLEAEGRAPLPGACFQVTLPGR